MLTLERPLVIFDSETTGVDVSKDRIIEMTFTKIFPDWTRETKTYRVNPGIPIPAGATLVHGISDEDVKELPYFSRYANGIVAYLKDCDLGGYNSNSYDFPLLYTELSRVGIEWDYEGVSFVDVCNIFKIKETRTLTAAVKFYCNKDHTEAHGAESDVLATIDCLKGQFVKYDDLPENIQELAIYSNYGKKMLDMSGLFVYNEAGIVIFGKGKNKDKPATDYDYLKWVYYTSTFPGDTKKLAKKFMDEIPFK